MLDIKPRMGRRSYAKGGFVSNETVAGPTPSSDDPVVSDDPIGLAPPPGVATKPSSSSSGRFQETTSPSGQRIYAPMEGYTYNANTGMYSNDEPGYWIRGKK